MAVHAVAPRRAAGLELEMAERIIERGAKLDSTPLQVRVEGAGGGIEQARAFIAAIPAFQPAEPPKVPAIRGAIEVAEATVLVIFEVKLGSQRKLPKIRCAPGAVGRLLCLRQRGQQQRRQ